MHSSRAVHRDINIDNIILTEDFKVKLINLDYGISILGRNKDGWNRTKLGSEGYMAPEIIEEKPY